MNHKHSGHTVVHSTSSLLIEPAIIFPSIAISGLSTGAREVIGCLGFVTPLCLVIQKKKT